MKKLLRVRWKSPFSASNKKGFTLVELLIGVGLFGIVFLAAFQIMGLGTRFSNDFVRSSKAVGFMSDAINLLNTLIPQTGYIAGIYCRGTGNSKADAAWIDTANTAIDGELSASNAWYDPVIDGPSANDGSFVTIFDAQVDTYFGGTDATDGRDETILSYITGTLGYGTNQTCRSWGSRRNNIPSRGCWQRLRLLYAAPVNELGLAPSEPGQLIIRLSDLNDATTASDHDITIGGAESKIGIARLSCGMPQRTANTNAMEFVLNIRLKFKNSYINLVTDPLYESWHPNGTNHFRGARREIKMRFMMPNLSQRGAYQWKMQGIQGCLSVGTAATHKDQCCSGAMSAANACQDCVRSGQAAASATMCCSGMLNGANCR